MDETALTCASTCRLRPGGQGTGGAGSPRGWQRRGWVGGLGWGRGGAGDTGRGRGRPGSTRRPQQCTTLTPLGSCCEHAGPAGSPSSSEKALQGPTHAVLWGGRWRAQRAVCAAHGRTQSGPASLGLSSWRLWHRAGFWSLWTSSRARRWPLSPM